MLVPYFLVIEAILGLQNGSNQALSPCSYLLILLLNFFGT